MLAGFPLFLFICIIAASFCCLEQIDLSVFPWVHGQGGERAKSLGLIGGSML